MTEERSPLKHVNNSDLDKTVSTGSLSSCSDDDVDIVPDVTFNIVGSSNEGTIDSTGTNRENQPLLSRDEAQPLNHIPGKRYITDPFVIYLSVTSLLIIPGSCFVLL